VANYVFERHSDQQQMNRIQAPVSLVIWTAFHRQFKLGERTDFRVGQLTWTTDEAIIQVSNSRTSLLCRVSEIIFGNQSNPWSKKPQNTTRTADSRFNDWATSNWPTPEKNARLVVIFYYRC
jgi:hypothetical protein